MTFRIPQFFALFAPFCGHNRSGFANLTPMRSAGAATLSMMVPHAGRSAATFEMPRGGLFFALALISFFSATHSYAAEEPVIAPTPPDHELLLIVGSPGEPDYEAGFRSAAEAWIRAADSTNARLKVVGLEASDTNDRELIQTWIDELEAQSAVPAWIVYIGHGTHTQKRTSINLKGPDLDAITLASWLDRLERTLIFIHGGSASAPFINRLSKPNRILMTATRSGEELNYARFGERFAQIIEARVGDANQDGQVSLLEAFVATARSVEAFYEENQRLASEHALIDDNGDATGTPADWFRGERLIKTPQDDRTPDGFRSRQIAFIASEQERLLSPEQRQRRDQLEIEMERLRSRKTSLEESAYYEQLETILLKLSKIYLAPTDDS